MICGVLLLARHLWLTGGCSQRPDVLACGW